MSEWQPIETAPKDGTPFLAAFDRGQIGVMYWESWGDEPDEGSWRGHWFEHDEDRATHWMPLPKPPGDA